MPKLRIANNGEFSVWLIRVGCITHPRKGMQTLDFPNDDNGDALRRLRANGEDLSRPRDIEFVVVFPTEASAEGFAQQSRVLGYAASIEHAETVPELP